MVRNRIAIKFPLTPNVTFSGPAQFAGSAEMFCCDTYNFIFVILHLRFHDDL